MARYHDAHFRGVLNQPLGNLDDGNLWNGQTEKRTYAGSKELVGQYSKVLGIVLVLHDVQCSIISKHQMGLRTTPHFTDLLHGGNGFRAEGNRHVSYPLRSAHPWG